MCYFCCSRIISPVEQIPLKCDSCRRGLSRHKVERIHRMLIRYRSDEGFEESLRHEAEILATQMLHWETISWEIAAFLLAASVASAVALATIEALTIGTALAISVVGIMSVLVWWSYSLKLAQLYYLAVERISEIDAILGTELMIRKWAGYYDEQHLRGIRRIRSLYHRYVSATVLGVIAIWLWLGQFVAAAEGDSVRLFLVLTGVAATPVFLFGVGLRIQPRFETS